LQALAIITQWKPNQVKTFADLLSLELIHEVYILKDMVTFRKGKSTLESIVWLLVGIAIYND
jgi:hypothetical protein